MSDPLLDLYLAEHGQPIPGDLLWESTLVAALRDARSITGRDVSSGVVNSPGNTMTWAGALAYLALIDQIGNAVGRVNMSQPRQGLLDQCPGSKWEAPFRKALVHFTMLDNDRIDALYALRCSFAHTYGLVNVGGQDRLAHKFTLVDSSSELVQLADPPWDGTTYPALTDPPMPGTVVNVRLLGDTVESMVRLIRTLHATRLIKRRACPVEEFRIRFTMRYRAP